MRRPEWIRPPHVCFGWLSAKLLSQADAELHGADETGGLQRIALVPVMPCREGDAARRARLAFEEPLGPFLEAFAVPFDVGRKLFVADEAVDPAVGDFNADVIGSGLHDARGVDAEGGLPEDAAVASVDEDAGVVMEHAEVEHKRRIDIFFRQIDRLPVGRGPGEEFDAVVFAFGEGDEFGEGGLFGGAEIRREGDFPCAVDGDGLRDADGGNEGHPALRVRDGEDAVLPCGQRDGAVKADDVIVRLADDTRGNLYGAVFGETDFERLAVQRVFKIQMLQMEDGGIAAKHVVGCDDVERAVLGDEALDAFRDILAGETVIGCIGRLLDDEIDRVFFRLLRIPRHVGDMVDALLEEIEDLFDGGLAEDDEQRTGLCEAERNADGTVDAFVGGRVNALSGLGIPQFGHAVIDAEDAGEFHRHLLRVADEIPVVAVVVLPMEIGDGACDLFGEEFRLEIRSDGEIFQDGFRLDAVIDAAVADVAEGVFLAVEPAP